MFSFSLSDIHYLSKLTTLTVRATHTQARVLNAVTKQGHYQRQVTGLWKGGKSQKPCLVSYGHRSSIMWNDSMNPWTLSPKTCQLKQHRSETHILHKKSWPYFSLFRLWYPWQSGPDHFSYLSVQCLVQSRPWIVTSWPGVICLWFLLLRANMVYVVGSTPARATKQDKREEEDKEKEIGREGRRVTEGNNK